MRRSFHSCEGVRNVSTGRQRRHHSRLHLESSTPSSPPATPTLRPRRKDLAHTAHGRCFRVPWRVWLRRDAMVRIMAERERSRTRHAPLARRFKRARGLVEEVSRGHHVAKLEVARLASPELPRPGQLRPEHLLNAALQPCPGGFDEASWRTMDAHERSRTLHTDRKSRSVTAGGRTFLVAYHHVLVRGT